MSFSIAPLRTYLCARHMRIRLERGCAYSDNSVWHVHRRTCSHLYLPHLDIAQRLPHQRRRDPKRRRCHRRRRHLLCPPCGWDSPRHGLRRYYFDHSHPHSRHHHIHQRLRSTRATLTASMVTIVARFTLNYCVISAPCCKCMMKLFSDSPDILRIAAGGAEERSTYAARLSSWLSQFSQFGCCRLRRARV